MPQIPQRFAGPCPNAPPRGLSLFGGSPRIYAGEERFSAPQTWRHFESRFSAGLSSARGWSHHFFWLRIPLD